MSDGESCHPSGELLIVFILGMDFAHVMNGYRYHTKYDHIDYLPPASLQRTGDNILALVKLIANSDQLANTKEFANGRMVFFDFLGFFFVVYSQFFGQILNVVVAIASVAISYYFLKTKGDLNVCETNPNIPMTELDCSPKREQSMSGNGATSEGTQSVVDATPVECQSDVKLTSEPMHANSCTDRFALSHDIN